MLRNAEQGIRPALDCCGKAKSAKEPMRRTQLCCGEGASAPSLPFSQRRGRGWRSAGIALQGTASQSNGMARDALRRKGTAMLRTAAEKHSSDTRRRRRDMIGQRLDESGDGFEAARHASDWHGHESGAKARQGIDRQRRRPERLRKGVAERGEGLDGTSTAEDLTGQAWICFATAWERSTTD
jgi:uncharacterized protein involved in exopolysaccharide biosynthesis